MLNCYQLKLPTLSTDLENDLLRVGEIFNASDGFNPLSMDEIGKDMQSWVDFHEETKTTLTVYNAYPIPESLHRRIHEEMTDQLFPFGEVSFYFQFISGGEHLMPHRDPDPGSGERKASILYNLSADNAITDFYKTSSTDPSKYLYSLHEIEKIESYQMVPHKWYSFNNAAIHGVSEIYKNRLAITCNLNMHPVLELPDYSAFCERYNHLLVHPDGLEPPTFAV